MVRLIPLFKKKLKMKYFLETPVAVGILELEQKNRRNEISRKIFGAARAPVVRNAALPRHGPQRLAHPDEGRQPGLLA